MRSLLRFPLAVLAALILVQASYAGPIQRIVHRLQGHRVRSANAYPGGIAQYQQFGSSPLAGYQWGGTLADGTPYYVPQAPIVPMVVAATGTAEQQLLDLCNANRSRAGLPHLVADSNMQAAAQAMVAWMVATRQFRHTGAFTRWGGASEIIAMGQSSPEEAVSSWMASRGHREAILGGFVRVGFATQSGYWCGVFGW